MENASLSPDYSHYGDDAWAELGDLPVDCVGGACAPGAWSAWAPLPLYAAALLLGGPGNALAGWAAWRVRRGARARWLLPLAAADLLRCLVLPLLEAPRALRGHWPFGEAGCRALPALGLLSLYASGLLLAALSVHLGLRALGARGACGAAWALALLLAAPTLLLRRLHREHFPEQLHCVLDHRGSVAAEHGLAAVRFALGFLAPLLLVAAGQAALLRRAPRRHWPLGSAVLAGFLLCCTPFHVLALLLALAAPGSALLARALQFEPLVVGLTLAQSCLNPLLFLYFGRARLRESLPAACRWALRESDGLDDSEAAQKLTSQDLLVSEGEGAV